MAESTERKDETLKRTFLELPLVEKNRQWYGAEDEGLVDADTIERGKRK